MQKIRDLFIAFLFATGTASAQPIVITDVTVIDVSEGVAVPGRTVVVSGDQIAAVGDVASVEVPTGATVIDGSGKYLIPGLWDMHVHSSSNRITREMMLPLYVANGVTGVRDMTADCFEPCEADRSTIGQVRGWTRDIVAGRLVGPRIAAASQELNGPPPGEPSSVRAPATEEHTRALVRVLEERGVDFIKVYDMLPREAYFALADEANKRGIPFAGHVPVEVLASEASDAGQLSMEHVPPSIFEECSERGDELRAEVRERLKLETPQVLPVVIQMIDSYSEARCERLFARFAENGTWHVPTLLVHSVAVMRGWRDDPRMRFVTRSEREVWEGIETNVIENIWGNDPISLARLEQKNHEIVLAMHRAGVRIMAGSDAAYTGAFPGFSLHDELELLAEAGLKPAEVLRAATLAPAEFLKATDSLGAVEEGKLADLVLLDANPLEDISNTQTIAAVVARGRLHDRDALDELLAGAERAAKSSEAQVPDVQPAPSDADSLVLQTVERFVRAFNDLDWETFRSSFAEDATVFFPMQDVVTRAEGREKVEGVFETVFTAVRSRRPGPPYLDIRPRDLDVQMFGDSAVVTFHLGTQEDGGVGRRTLVLHKQGGQWRIVHLHASNS